MSLIRAASELSLSRRKVLLVQLEQAVRNPAARGAASLSDFQSQPIRYAFADHKIHRLSAQYGRTIYAVDIAGDLRATFYVESETVWSVSIGAHALYKG